MGKASITLSALWLVACLGVGKNNEAESPDLDVPAGDDAPTVTEDEEVDEEEPPAEEEEDEDHPEPDAPRVLSLSTNVSSITEGQSVQFFAIVTDPDGIEDVIGGQLTDDQANVYGIFATDAQEGAYSLELSWYDLNLVQPITFTGSASWTFSAEFFDVAGNIGKNEVSLDYTCGSYDAACAGDCVNYDDNSHCGACFNDCTIQGDVCYAGECTNGIVEHVHSGSGSINADVYTGTHTWTARLTDIQQDVCAASYSVGGTVVEQDSWSSNYCNTCDDVLDLELTQVAAPIWDAQNCSAPSTTDVKAGYSSDMVWLPYGYNWYSALDWGFSEANVSGTSSSLSYELSGDGSTFAFEEFLIY